MESEGLSNGPPPQISHHVTEGSNCEHRGNRNQGHDKAVLEKVLTFIVPDEAFDYVKCEAHWSAPD
jgi:hypothetical protein